MEEERSYKVFIGPRQKNGETSIVFQPNPDALSPLSLPDAQEISSSFCGKCPNNPENQATGETPFVSRCKTFDGKSLITTIVIPTALARREAIRSAVCQPTPRRRS